MFKIKPNDNTMMLTKSNSAEFIISPTVADPNENKIKIVLGAVEKIQNGEEMTEQQVRIIESLINSLN